MNSLKQSNNLPRLKSLVRIGVDFDLSLCKSAYDPATQKWPMGVPMKGAEEGLRKLEEMGYKPWIFTSRPAYEEIEIWEWLRRWGMKKYVHGIITGKPLFLVVIDDRAIQFKNWEQAVKEVEKYGKKTK
jgi:hypothetical protein